MKLINIINNIILNENKIKSFINEISSTSTSSIKDVDDGRLGPWYNNVNDYKNNNKKLAEQYGYIVLDYLFKDEQMGKEYERFIAYIFPAGDQANQNDNKLLTKTKSNPNDLAVIVKMDYNATKKHYDLYRNKMSNSAIRMGYEVLKWMEK